MDNEDIINLEEVGLLEAICLFLAWLLIAAVTGTLLVSLMVWSHSLTEKEVFSHERNDKVLSIGTR